jgi:hypothetical protein
MTGFASTNCWRTDGRRRNNRSQAAAPSLNFKLVARFSVIAVPALVIPLLNRRTQIQPPDEDEFAFAN